MPELAKKVLARRGPVRAEQEARKREVPPEAVLVPPPPGQRWNAGTFFTSHLSPLTSIEALLDLPMAKLTRPLPVWSALLGELIYLVPDEATAQRLLAEGKVAYFPEEVAILLEIQARHPDTWREKVQKIHWAKKEFGGLVIRCW